MIRLFYAAGKAVGVFFTNIWVVIAIWAFAGAFALLLSLLMLGIGNLDNARFHDNFVEQRVENFDTLLTLGFLKPDLSPDFWNKSLPKRKEAGISCRLPGDLAPYVAKYEERYDTRLKVDAGIRIIDLQSQSDCDTILGRLRELASETPTPEPEAQVVQPTSTSSQPAAAKSDGYTSCQAEVESKTGKTGTEAIAALVGGDPADWAVPTWAWGAWVYNHPGNPAPLKYPGWGHFDTWKATSGTHNGVREDTVSFACQAEHSKEA